MLKGPMSQKNKNKKLGNVDLEQWFSKYGSGTASSVSITW